MEATVSHSPNTILLIADISGYTRFMKQHTIAISHAKQIIVRLLKALMNTAQPPLKVAELEGDAVFFYARAQGTSLETIAHQVKDQMVALFAAFRKELHSVDSLRTCACDACTHIHDLQLKEVLHVGRVEVETIGQFEKLFGFDVILVHRLLKNSVQANEYVMMTEPAFSCVKDFHGLAPERTREVFEGVGEIDTLVFYPQPLWGRVPIVPAEVCEASVVEKWKWRWEISYKALADWIGIRKIDGVFDSLPT
jgi:hypothetical protein